MNLYYSPTNKPIFQGTRIVWYILTVLETLLIFRFILKLVGANPLAEFTAFVYKVSEPFVLPFFNVIKAYRVEGKVFEWTTLIAITFYWLFATGVIKLFLLMRDVSSEEAGRELRQQDKKYYSKQ